MERRLPILTEWKQRIRTAGEGIPLPEGWQDEIISLHDEIERMFQNVKLGLVGIEAPPPPEVDPVIEARVRSNPKLAAAFQGLVQDHLKDGLDGKVRLLDEMSKGFQSMIPKLYTRSYNLPITQQTEVNAVLLHPNQHKSKSPITSARIKTYRKFRESRGGAAKHIDQQVGKMERLSAFLKAEELPLSFDAVDAWLKSLNRAPTPLSQYLIAGTAFWKWAVKYDSVCLRISCSL